MGAGIPDWVVLDCKTPLRRGDVAGTWNAVDSSTFSLRGCVALAGVLFCLFVLGHGRAPLGFSGCPVLPAGATPVGAVVGRPCPLRLTRGVPACGRTCPRGGAPRWWLSGGGCQFPSRAKRGIPSLWGGAGRLTGLSTGRCCQGWAGLRLRTCPFAPCRPCRRTPVVHVGAVERCRSRGSGGQGGREQGGVGVWVAMPPTGRGVRVGVWMGGVLSTLR